MNPMISKFYQNAQLGEKPQNLKYRDTKTKSSSEISSNF